MVFQFEKNSVLLEQPLLLDIKQRRFLVGIRFAVQSIGLSKARLWTSLELWRNQEQSATEDVTVAELFTDVWSIVDNARRLHRLLWKIPHLNEIGFVKSFVEKWEIILKSVRGAIQHFDGEVSQENMPDNYVFGQLHWIDSISRGASGEVYVYFVPAGPQANNLLRPTGFPMSIPVDSGDSIYPVILETGGESLNISDLLTDIEKTIKLLESELREIVDHEMLNALFVQPEQKDKIGLIAKVDRGFEIVFSNFRIVNE